MFLLFLFFSSSIFSQTIKGKIVNLKGENIRNGNVIIKDEIDSEFPKEFTYVTGGNYNINLKKSYKKIIIEVKSNGYKDNVFEIVNPIKEKIYIQNFTLINEEITNLEEVIISSKKKPFIIKKDTLIYNISSYKDGTERKLQDVLIKLPGIDVNEKSGEIKYKGKNIETIKLEGDDLFGSNYSIGSKNINIDMVEQIQAIENYSDNPLLKGIVSEDKVALNLILKKNKIDFSGNIDFGSGFFTRDKMANDIGSNILGISKNYKSFSILSFNNIGENNSPFDFFSSYQNEEQQKENAFYAKKFINENLIGSSHDDNRANLNNQFFANYNSTFKINNKINLKTNFYFLNDKILNFQFLKNIYYISNDIMSSKDSLDTKKNPTLYKGNIDLIINTSKNSLLEYKLSIFQENVLKQTNGLISNNNILLSDLNTQNVYINNNILYTQKLSQRKAIQLSIISSFNEIPQKFSEKISNLDENYSVNKQFSNFKKNYQSINGTFLNSINDFKYNFKIGCFINSNSFYSILDSNHSSTPNLNIKNQNDTFLNNKSLYISGSLNISHGKFRILPSLQFEFLDQNINNYITNLGFSSSHLILKPNFTLKYIANETSLALISINYGSYPLIENYIFTDDILINSRTFQSNTINLGLQKSLYLNVFYLIHNIHKQFRMNFGVIYMKNKGNFISNINIQNSDIYLNNFYLNEFNNNLNINFLMEKYIPKIESTIRFKTNFSFSNYKNILNNSQLRDNNNLNFNYEVFMKTAFNFLINFENVLKYNKNIYNKENQNNSINNNFKIIIKPSKEWLVLFTSDYFIPKIENLNVNYLFLKSYLQYTPKNNKLNYRIVGENLLNEKFFTQNWVSDYSSSFYQYRLIPRYIALNINYNF